MTVNFSWSPCNNTCLMQPRIVCKMEYAGHQHWFFKKADSSYCVTCSDLIYVKTPCVTSTSFQCLLFSHSVSVMFCFVFCTILFFFEFFFFFFLFFKWKHLLCQLLSCIWFWNLFFVPFCFENKWKDDLALAAKIPTGSANVYHLSLISSDGQTSKGLAFVFGLDKQPKFLLLF